MIPTLLSRPLGSNDNYHQISATYGIRKMRGLPRAIGPLRLSCRSFRCTMKQFRLPRWANIAHPGTARPPVSDFVMEGDAQSQPRKTTNKNRNKPKRKSMKKLLLIALAVSGL